MINRKEDRTLLLGVAGVVVAGAAGIALIAGMQSSAEQEVAALPQNPPQAVERRPVVWDSVQPPSADGGVQPQPVDEPSPPGEVIPAAFITEPAAQPEAAALPEVPSFQVDPDKDPLSEGQRLYALKQFDEAVAYLDVAVSRQPEHGWSHTMLGLAQWKSGDLDAAADNLRRAGELSPQSTKPWINLSRVENERGEFEAALAASEQALTVDEQDAQALFVKGRSLYNLGRSLEALDALQASRDADAENGHVANLIGLTLIEAGRYDEALPQLEDAARLEPDVAYIQNNLGIVRERADDFAGAAVAYARAVELRPGYSKAESSLTRIQPHLPTQPEPIAIAEGPSVDEAIEVDAPVMPSEIVAEEVDATEPGQTEGEAQPAVSETDSVEGTSLTETHESPA